MSNTVGKVISCRSENCNVSDRVYLNETQIDTLRSSKMHQVISNHFVIHNFNKDGNLCVNCLSCGERFNIPMFGCDRGSASDMKHFELFELIPLPDYQRLLNSEMVDAEKFQRFNIYHCVYELKSISQIKITRVYYVGDDSIVFCFRGYVEFINESHIWGNLPSDGIDMIIESLKRQHEEVGMELQKQKMRELMGL